MLGKGRLISYILGILIKKLNEKQKFLKQDFIETFHIYSASEIQKIFHDLL